ncbi:hypothetical protein ZHAS_00009098 [Anopheles sinensis]|uniref:Uncharacterized protein n=1 Tax=Anopheles sinensis TaxID=74873 RepID=A0A084VU18_ANOSI|nr:hypothetical protein ZHAS_00009098 [Anopheles sinensis]
MEESLAWTGAVRRSIYNKLVPSVIRLRQRFSSTTVRGPQTMFIIIYWYPERKILLFAMAVVSDVWVPLRRERTHQCVVQ